MNDEALGAAEPVADATPEPTSGDAIERAFRSTGLLDDAPSEPEAEAAQDEPQDGPARAPDGKFAAKEPATPEAEKPAEATPEKPAEAKPADVPARFSPDAKAEWEKTPAPVRAEINRALREMESGIAKYRDEVEPLRRFMLLARQSGTTVEVALGKYVATEQRLVKDPIGGLDEICRNLGTSLADVAAHVMKQPAPQRDAQVARLHQEIADLKQQVSSVTGTVSQQTERATLEQINQFAAQPGRERFNELSETMARLITDRYATDLEDAYEKASRLIPAPVSAPPSPAPVAQPTVPAAHTRKASLSVQGAPGSGSNPASRQRSASTDEALRRAFSAVGL